MSDHLKRRGEPDRSRINVHEEHELKYWMRELGVDELTLKDLVQRHGTSVTRIRQDIREIRRRG